MDIQVLPSLTIPAHELSWRFSRSSGPGGQHVNTADTQVELAWNVLESTILTPSQRQRLIAALKDRLIAGELRCTSSDHRSQHRNREEASRRLAQLVREGLAPPPPKRRPTKPSRAAVKRTQKTKRHRSEIKRLRRKPPLD